MGPGPPFDPMPDGRGGTPCGCGRPSLCHALAVAGIDGASTT